MPGVIKTIVHGKMRAEEDVEALIEKYQLEGWEQRIGIIILALSEMTQTLMLIRGLPGSGKSTLASKLAQEQGSIHLETDMYFVEADGEYRFNPLKLEQAHQWCQQQTEHYLKQGQSVIVSNTFVRHWEMKAYQDIAKRCQVELVIHICRDNYGSIHDIEPSTIAKMKSNWQS